MRNIVAGLLLKLAFKILGMKSQTNTNIGSNDGGIHYRIVESLDDWQFDLLLRSTLKVKVNGEKGPIDVCVTQVNVDGRDSQSVSFVNTYDKSSMVLLVSDLFGIVSRYVETGANMSPNYGEYIN